MGGPNKSNYLGGVFMLIIWLDSELPDNNEYVPDSFIELTRHTQLIRFMIPRKEEERSAAKKNWKEFLSVNNTPGSKEAWRKLLNNSGDANQKPKKAKSIVGFVCMNVEEMLRKIMRESINAPVIETVGQYRETLQGYASDNSNVGIYDRYLLKFQIETLRKKGKIKAPGDMKRSLRILLDALSSHGWAPETVSIISRCSQFREYSSQKNNGEDDYEKWVNSPKYYQNVKELLSDLFSSIREVLPEYEKTSFVIHDCSNLDQRLTHHDRFINIMSNVLISSAGYNLDPGKKFNTANKIPGETSLGPTYIIPVQAHFNFDPGSLDAIVFEDI